MSFFSEVSFELAPPSVVVEEVAPCEDAAEDLSLAMEWTRFRSL